MKLRSLVLIPGRPLALALLLCSCAGRQTPHVVLAADRLARAEALHAQTLAPAAYEAFQAAKRRADASPIDSEERADRHTEARLWLETAIATAATEELSAQRLELEKQIHRLMSQALDYEAERAKLVREANRQKAAEVARLEAKAALERAAARPGERPKLSNEDVRRAAAALIIRAKLVHAAARSLQDDETAEGKTVAAQIERAQATAEKQPEQALALADSALFAAMALLGPLREAQEGPGPEERAALAEALDLSGAKPVRSDVGLSAELSHAFRGGRLDPQAKRIVGRLCSIARAHPHGPVQGVARGRSMDQARARAEAVGRALEQLDCPLPRLTVEPIAQTGPDWTMTWLAY